MAKKRRHTTYKDWITEEGIIKLEGMAMDGLINEQIAHNIGIHPSTLCDWQKKYPEIAHALKRGKEVVDYQVENALVRRALGFSVDETKTIVERDGQGKEKKRIEKTTRYFPPDTTAIAIWLNNRKPDKYRRNAGKERLDEQKFEHEKKIDEKKYW